MSSVRRLFIQFALVINRSARGVVAVSQTHQVFALWRYPSPSGDSSGDPCFRSRFRLFICGASAATYQPHRYPLRHHLLASVRQFVPWFMLSSHVFAKRLSLHTTMSEVSVTTSFVSISISVLFSWPLVRSKLIVNRRPKVMSKFYSLSDFVPVILH